MNQNLVIFVGEIDEIRAEIDEHYIRDPEYKMRMSQKNGE